MILQIHLSRLVSKGCKLVGCGSAVPNLQVSNDDLAKIVDTSDEWISVRIGIRNRCVLTSKLILKVLACHLPEPYFEYEVINEP